MKKTQSGWRDGRVFARHVTERRVVRIDSRWADSREDALQGLCVQVAIASPTSTLRLSSYARGTGRREASC